MISNRTITINPPAASWLNSTFTDGSFRDSHPFLGAPQETRYLNAPDRRRELPPRGKDRRKTPRRPISDLTSHTVLGRKRGYLLARPNLLDCKSAWAALDLLMAFLCGTLAIVLHVEDHGRLPSFVPVAFAGPYWRVFPAICGILFALAVAALSRIHGLQRLKEGRTALVELLSVVQSVSLSAFGVFGALHFWDMAAVAREALPTEILLTSAVMFASRMLCRSIRQQRFQQDIAVRNFIIVGDNSVGREVRDYLESRRYSGYRFGGFITADKAVRVPQGDHDERIGTIDEVISLAKSKFVDEIIFSERPATDILAGVLEEARAMGIDVRLIPSLTETLANRDDVQYIDALPTIVLHQRVERPFLLWLKRTFDVLFGSVALLLASPVLLAIAIGIKLQSRGPVFYASERVGHKGGVFTCYKFRTMVPNAEALRSELAHLNERNGILFKIARDPRITPIGAILRKYSLDELPQLWNVVRGDMSLVGPRPSIRSEVSQYATPHLRRLDVVPGMTGLWQVEARRDPSFDSYVTLDSKYVNEWSFWLDLKIIFRTLNVVVAGTGV